MPTIVPSTLDALIRCVAGLVAGDPERFDLIYNYLINAINSTVFGVQNQDNTIKIQQSDPTRPDVNLAVGKSTNYTGVPNQVVVLGHNAHPLQGREDSTKHEWAFHQEYEFELSPGGSRECEVFQQFTSADGLTSRRPIGINTQKDLPYNSFVTFAGQFYIHNSARTKQWLSFNDPPSGQATWAYGTAAGDAVIVSFEKNNVGIIQQTRADGAANVELLRLDSQNDLQIAAGVAALGGVVLNGRWKAPTQITPTALSGDVNDYNPAGLATAARLRIDGGAANRNITGLALGSDGRILWLRNIGTTNNLVLVHESASSSAANRFNLPGAANFTMTPGTGVELMFDVDRWKVAS